MQAQAVRIAAQGTPDVMKLESVALPAPGASEVLIRQTAIGVNFMDVYHRGGQYPLPLPSGIGIEAAGVIEAVGSAVTDLKKGDRVVYAGSAPGSYADWRNMPAERLVKIPGGVSEEIAAALLTKGMTAEYLLNRCYTVKPGEFVLFLAAAGGVGLVAGQWGKYLGARMIGVAGGAAKCQMAKENGYEFVIDRNKEDIVARVKEITGGAEVIELGPKKMNSRAYCTVFNFRGGDQQKLVGNLSGGERGRLHMAKTLLMGGNVLMLDEPSNDLDIETLRALEDALLEFAGSVLVISHDRWFLDRIATHILAFEGNSQVTFFDGNYQEYEADKKKRLGEEGAKPKRLRYKSLTVK